MEENPRHPAETIPWPFPAPLQQVLEAIPAAIVCFDTELRSCWANPAAGELLGQPHQEMLDREFFCPGGVLDCGGPETCPVARTRSTGRRHETICRAREGGFLRVRAEPVLDGEKRLQGVVTFVQPATFSSETATEAIQRAETAPPSPAAAPADAADYEAGFFALLEAMGEAMVVQDGSGRLVAANQAFARLCGMPRETLLGRRAEEFAVPGRSDPKAVARCFERGLAGEREEFRFWAARADGRQFLLNIAVSPTTHRGRPAVVALVRDVTADEAEREQQQRDAVAWRESAERFRQLLARVPTVAVQGYGVDGTVRYWNEASERLYGYTAAEALGRNLLDLIIPGAMRDQVRAGIRAMAETGETLPAAELQLVRKDGSTVHVFSSHAVVRIPGGATELFCLDIDLADRHRAEAERLEMMRQLHQKQKMESLGVLAGGIAHDFNNLLTTIIGNLDLLSRELPERGTARASLEEAIGAAQSAASLTRQIMAASGRGRTTLRPVDPHLWLRAQVEAIRATLPGQIQLEVELLPQPPPVRADQTQLAQMLNNLVTNSIEAFGERAGRIVLRTSVVELTAEQLAENRVEPQPCPGRFLVIEVADDAGGMDAPTLQRVLEPFFTTKFVGRGLGIPVVLGLTRAHHGALFVRSQIGRGTSVQVCLPLETGGSASGTPVPATQTGARAAASRGMLLVIDDEEPIRRLTARMAERLGFEVISAATGEAGVARFREFADRVRCVLVDLSMPGKDGVTCAREIRAIRPGTAVVLMSGFAEEDMAARYSEASLSGFLQKPFTLAQFSAVLDRLAGPAPT